MCVTSPKEKNPINRKTILQEQRRKTFSDKRKRTFHRCGCSRRLFTRRDGIRGDLGPQPPEQRDTCPRGEEQNRLRGPCSLSPLPAARAAWAHGGSHGQVQAWSPAHGRGEGRMRGRTPADLRACTRVLPVTEPGVGLVTPELTAAHSQGLWGFGSQRGNGGRASWPSRAALSQWPLLRV